MDRAVRSVVALGFLLSCDTQQPSAPPQAPPPAQRERPDEVEAAKLRAHVEFLTADRLDGRVAGTAGDGAAQEYIESAMRTAGLEPGFGTMYRQVFEVVDGVRLVEGGRSSLMVDDREVPHDLVPFAQGTAKRGAVEAKLVFVGEGLAADYAGIGDVVRGNIVVAFAGGSTVDSSGSTRAQSKLIAARDRGAAGFVLWDPASDTGFPNHGRAQPMGLPALAVGSAANLALQAAFGVRKPTESLDPDTPGIVVGTMSRAEATLRCDIERVVLETANVAGLLVGNGTASKMVIIGAHHDHRSPGEGPSNDNASGVAAVLELCGALARLPDSQRPYDVLCVTFGAHEMGLLGAQHFVEDLDEVRRESIVGMVNFDTIGGSSNNVVNVAGVGTASQWNELLLGQDTPLQVVTKSGGQLESDHGPFYEDGIPVLHIFAGRRVAAPSSADYEGMADVASLVLGVVDELVHTRSELDFQRTNAAESFESPGPSEPAESSRPSTSSKPTESGSSQVSLGTIPDYATVVDGLKLAGVREGSAAAQAGLQKGDVIRRLGEREVHSVDDYMEAVQRLVPGREVVVGVEREGERLELQLTPRLATRP